MFRAEIHFSASVDLKNLGGVKFAATVLVTCLGLRAALDYTQ